MTLAIFHPAFYTVGGAEILVAYYARSLKKSGLDVTVVTLSFAPRLAPWLDGVPPRVVPKPPWTDLFRTHLGKLRRTAARAERCLRGFDTVLAFNFPANLMLGASSIASRRAWYCTEPPRHWHVVETNPRLYGRVKAVPGGITDAERVFAKKLEAHEKLTSRPSHRTKEIAFDIESTKKLDTILALSEFGRDNVRRVYGRTDVEVIYPIVRFPEERPSFPSGLRRDGLKILTHSRLEITKNVDNVVRGFALFLSKVPGSELHVLGEGKEKESLEKLVHLGIGGAVRFHGYVPESDSTASTTCATCSRSRRSTSRSAWSTQRRARAAFC